MSDTNTEPTADIAVIGLAVMGQNLILNAADHGFNVVAFNRTVSKVDAFLANEAKGKVFPSNRADLHVLILQNHRQVHPRCTLDRRFR
jgi:6-phosphogluconate dehydrogenase